MSEFTVVSTFAGCGGSSLGYKMAGGDVRLAVELDDNAVETYRLNHPSTTVYHGDIKALTVAEAMRLAGVGAGELDVLDGSPPCQGFSMAGDREFGDGRNQLFAEFVRLLTGLKPKAFVMENVSGMVRGDMRLIFRDALRALKSAGYRVSCRLLDAAWYGVPQHRRRVIFVGARDDLGLEPTHPRPTVSRYVTIKDAIGDLLDVPMGARPGHEWVDESPAGRNTATWPKAHAARQGERYAGFATRYHWDRPAATITTGSGGMMAPYLRNSGCHPLRTRTYSMLEMMRLATFPDDYRFPGGMAHAAHRIGNTVPPRFMEAIASHVRDTLIMPSRQAQGHGLEPS